MNLNIRKLKFPFWNIPFLVLIKKALKELNVGYTDECCNESFSSGRSAASIPTPIIGFKVNGPESGTYNELKVHFDANAGGFDFTKGNPEIFLFRYRNNRKTTRRDEDNNIIKRIKSSKFVHPSTDGAETKWAGWKFFSGKQYDADGTEISGRITEWSIPSTIKPYQRFTLNFVKQIFWYTRATTSGEPVVSTDNAVDFNSVNGYTLTSPVNQNGQNIYIRQADNTNGFKKAQKFALAVAIDNPEATKTNGLPPKIFGPLSEPFYTTFKVESGTGGSTTSRILYVKFDKIASSRTARINERTKIFPTF